MNNINCDIALVHPPCIYSRERYAIFPLPWNLSHVGSSSYIGRYPIGPSWNEMPLGFFTMKNFFKNNSNYKVEIINLASLKLNFELNVPKTVLEKVEHIHRKDKSILKKHYNRKHGPDAYYGQNKKEK